MLLSPGLSGWEPKNLIVRMPNWIGDCVMATPVLADLKVAFPSARLTAMCRSPLAELLVHDPSIDEVFSFSKASGFERRRQQRSVIGKLRIGGYDLGILLTHSLSSAWWFWFGRVQHRIGYERNLRAPLLTQGLSFPTHVQQHLTVTYKTLLTPLGIPVSSTPPRLYLTSKEVEEARGLLCEHKVPHGVPLVGINPGATYGSAKCWLPDRFREVTHKLLKHPDLHVLYFGDLATKDLVSEICARFPVRVVNIAGKTSLRSLPSLISLCDVFLTNDSGPMHIADAVGTRLVALFGSTSEVITGPYHGAQVIHKHVACSPCYKRVCPLDFRCMRQIEVEEVYDAVCNALDAQSSERRGFLLT